MFRGVVQGVGFRPTIYRHATDAGLTGWVANTPEGALVEVEGPRRAVEAFVVGIRSHLPPRASVHSLEITHLDPAGFSAFEIRESRQEGHRIAHVPPDIATCDDCLREMRDPRDRRYRYPFINCTNCGPRYSIICALPYDRPNTTMSGFTMCTACLAEYRDPGDRRFHAQPNACPACGPTVELWAPDRSVTAQGDRAILSAAAAIRNGSIVAVKGLGGFHLLARADSEAAVAALRLRKRREEKPLALMCPTLASARRLCTISPMEARALTGPERPIVLVRKRTAVAEPVEAVAEPVEAVAPGNPWLGLMLPYTPLHHLLLAELAMPVVATSGNVSDEPICTDELAALHALGGIADLFLVHDRPIRRHVDDSIVRVVMGREQVLRRARGFAPLPIPLAGPGATILAVGAHLKNAPALAVGDCAYVSRHIGDLDTQPARRAHRQALDDLESLHEAAPATIAHDSHPDYASSVAARERAARAGDSARAGHVEGIARFAVQHHLAHVLSCMAENAIEPPVLGVAWDGTGLGDDGAIWGGEFLLVRADRCERVAHLRPFGLAGGDAAVREPRRSALGVLHALHGDALPPGWHTDDAGWDTRVAPALLRMLSAGVNAPVTTSAGRLFDAVASLIGLRHVARFEGQAAMELEWLIRNDVPPASYRLEAAESDASGCEPRVFDWGPMLERIRADADAGMPRAAIARGFHDALVSAIVWAATSAGVARVALTGGCFQNRYLAEQAERASVAAGFRVYTHQRVPPNDGGIALGQIVAARMGIARCEPPTAVC